MTGDINLRASAINCLLRWQRFWLRCRIEACDPSFCYPGFKGEMTERPTMNKLDFQSQVIAGAKTAFVDSSSPSDEEVRPNILVNSKVRGDSLLAIIKRELLACDSFDLCVAFVAESGLQPLVQVLAELKSKGVHGRILTSTYLNFNKPQVFKKLLEYDNIETRVYQGNLHAKGYVFELNGAATIIVGSSNLTQKALTCNKEWNVLFRSHERGEMFQSVRAEFDALWCDADTALLTEEWIDEYRTYRSADDPKSGKHLAAFKQPQVPSVELDNLKQIKPNKMQGKALEALSLLHTRNESRALLVSATGTGKTYLSAFEVAAVKPRRVLFLAHRQRILDASCRSYRRLLGDTYSYAMYEPGSKQPYEATCLFAMCSTLCKHLDDFDSKHFDYIVIDEAHRVGAKSYQDIMAHFAPDFYLGMTATPNRTDGYDVFAVFNHMIAYQITLQDALTNEMLVPFHYFGIADLSIDYEEKDDVSLFARLTSEERVRHIVEKIEQYTVDKENIRGLIFCNRNDEAEKLSAMFNNRGYRTTALSGSDSDIVRDAAIARLESGELEYIFSVDIFNEGIDIPSVNQIIMLRRTESAIVFIQQLGRGLRKCKERGKESTLVLDFIGNYQRNFFVPVALSGDKTYNKDTLRKIVKEGTSVIPGASTVSFDRVSEARIYRAIDGGDFTAARFLRSEYADLRQMLGRIPALQEFDRNGSIDPLLIFKKFGSYHAFLAKYEKEYNVSFSKQKCSILRFISQKLANGKRFEELFMLRELLLGHEASSVELIDTALQSYKKVSVASTIISAHAVLYGDFSTGKDFVPLVMAGDDGYALTSAFSQALQDEEFARQVLEVVEFGLSRYYASYGEPYKDTNFVLYGKYTYEEVCRLLEWDKNINGQNIGGYKYDKQTNTYPVFINYDKDPEISDSIKYEDRFLSDRELVAISKQPRDLSSPEIMRLKEWPDNGMRTYLFMRKNKNDEGSKEFYFLGEMYPIGKFEQIVMPGANKKAVEITYRLDCPVRHDIYEFMTADLNETVEVE